MKQRQWGSGRVWVVGSVVALVAAGVAGGPVTAYADDAVSSSAAVRSAIESVAPEVLTNVDHVSTTSQGDTAIQATAQGTMVSVPTEPTEGITIDSSSDVAAPVTVGLPFASAADPAKVAGSGVVSYDNGNGSTTVPVVKTDGSVQITTVIADAAAPQRYVYPVTVPVGGSLRLNTDDGTVSVLGADGQYVAGFGTPWAKDASGAAVPTRYEVDGASLIQVVDLSSPALTYPVVADPWLGIGLIDHVKWVNYGKWSPTLAITPTWYGRYGPVAAGWAAWDEVVKKGGSRANTSSMNTQFFCHWDAVRVYKPNKPTWDLDSKRPNTSLVNEIRNKCNYPDGGTEW